MLRFCTRILSYFFVSSLMAEDVLLSLRLNHSSTFLSFPLEVRTGIKFHLNYTWRSKVNNLNVKKNLILNCLIAYIRYWKSRNWLENYYIRTFKERVSELNPVFYKIAADTQGVRLNSSTSMKATREVIQQALFFANSASDKKLVDFKMLKNKSQA